MMLERIRELAHLSVGRACAFGALAILLFFVGLSSEIVVALKFAGYLSLLMCSILVLKAVLAYRQPYRRTELWVMLKSEERPQAEVAQVVISGALREAYVVFARQSAILTALFLGSAVVAALLQR